jgi:hypothetical protein
MKFSFIFLLLLICNTEMQASGPWTQKKGEAYTQLAFYAIPAVNRLHINAFKTQFLNRSVFDATAQLYAEYGLLNKFTVSASLPLKFVSTGNKVLEPDQAMIANGAFAPSDSILDAGLLVDLGNIFVEAKYNFYKKKILLTAHLALCAPAAIQKYNPKTALRTAHPCFGFQPSLSLGFSSKKIYTFFGTGMNFRTHNFSHQWIADFELGWKISEKAYLAVNLNANVALPGGANIPGSNEDIQTGLYINNQNFVAFTFKAIIPANDNIGVILSFSGGLWANNVQQGPSIGIGVYYKWKKKSKEA